MIDGKENHLVKLDKRCPEYKPPAKDAPIEIVKKKKGKKRKNKSSNGSRSKKKQKKTINSKIFFVFLTQKKGACQLHHFSNYKKILGF